MCDCNGCGNLIVNLQIEKLNAIKQLPRMGQLLVFDSRLVSKTCPGFRRGHANAYFISPHTKSV